VAGVYRCRDVLHVEDLGHSSEKWGCRGWAFRSSRAGDRVGDLPPAAVATPRYKQPAFSRSPRPLLFTPAVSRPIERAPRVQCLVRAIPRRSSMMWSSGSLRRRARLSVDSSHRVTTPTPAFPRHHSSMLENLFGRPSEWPLLTSRARPTWPTAVAVAITRRARGMPPGQDSRACARKAVVRPRNPCTDSLAPSPASET